MELRTTANVTVPKKEETYKQRRTNAPFTCNGHDGHEVCERIKIVQVIHCTSESVDWAAERVETWYTRLRNVAGWLAALVMLVVSIPVILVAALLIKLSSRGPAIYWQTRLGRFGRPFSIVKLRTMKHDCEKESGPMWSTRGDPRITLVGRILRATHVDELPQLWNVLKGEMCLIGPRPERPEFVDRLVSEVPYYAERMLIRPGITGLAQVNLPADNDLEDVKRKLAYDLYYIRRPGLWTDFKITACTALKMSGLPIRFLRKLFRMPDPRKHLPHLSFAADPDLVAHVQTSGTA
jgi:lipopolysaccharide/colanic/teichoic acid biosynthesis glycosyltransferase